MGSQGALRVPHSFREPDVARLTSSIRNVDPYTGMALFIGVPVTIEAVKAYATVEEICTALRDVYGVYEEPAF